MNLWKLQRKYAGFTAGISGAARFAKDGGAADGDGGGDGDAGKDKGGGGGDKTFDVPVGEGKTVKMTEAELVAAASKVAGADKKFEEASKIRKQYEGVDLEKAQQGQRVMDLAGKGENMSEDEATEFFTILKIDPSLTGGTKDGKGKPAAKPKKIEFDALDERTQAALKASEDQQIHSLEEKIKNQVRNAIDKDEVLGKIKSGMPKESQEGFAGQLYEMGIDDTLGRVYAGQKLGADLLELVVQKLRKRAESMGIPELLKTRSPASVRVPGLESLGQEIHAEEPIKRVASGQDGYDQNSISRLAQRILQKRRTQG